MNLRPLAVEGAWLVEPSPQHDERGWFARLVDHDIFVAHGISVDVSQESVAWNARRGTLRGMHYQTGDAAEGKLIRCLRGSLYDVVIDLRPTSPTYLRWSAAVLSDENRLALWAPRGTAHGYLTLADGTEVLYRIDSPYAPESATGVRWDDPTIAVEWPALPTVMSERDASWPLLGADR